MKKVTVYSKNACASCVMVKKWLAMKQVQYDEINTDEHPETLPHVMKISGASTLPVVVVEDEANTAVSIGYKPGQLAALVGA